MLRVLPCLPSPTDRPPSGAGWIHEIKHDGFRMMVRRAPVFATMHGASRGPHTRAAQPAEPTIAGLQPWPVLVNRRGSAQREAQMLVRLSIIGAVAAILMLPTTLSALTARGCPVSCFCPTTIRGASR